MKRMIEHSEMLRENDPIVAAMMYACQTELDLFSAILDELVIQSKDYTKLASWFLHSIAKNIVGLNRNYQELDTELLIRMIAITHRGAVKKWNTAQAGRAFLQYYYPESKIRSLVPIIRDNYLLNGDFEQPNQTAWTTNNAIITEDKKFSRTQSAGLSKDSKISQTVTLPKGKHALRFAHQGFEVKLEMLSSAGYWNPNLNIVEGIPKGAFATDLYQYEYPSVQEWEVNTEFITLEQDTELTITITTKSEREPDNTRNLAKNKAVYGESYRDLTYRQGQGTNDGAVAFVDYVSLGEYYSPSILYLVNFDTTSKQNVILKDIRNLYDNSPVNESASYRDDTYRSGLNSDLTTSSQLRYWEKIIGASGVETKIEVIS